MPNAVIAHAPDGKFDLDALKKEAREWPGLVGMDLVPMVTSGQRFTWDETPWDWGKGYGRQDKPEFHVVAIDYGIKRNILRLLAANGCKVTVVPATTSAEEILALKPDGVFLSNGPGDPAATGEYAVPVIREHHRPGHADLRHLPRPPDARHRARRHDHEDASGPSRRQPSGEGPHHRQGRDHLDEPRLRGRPRRACRRTRWRPTSRCSTARNCGIALKDKPVFSVQYHPEASPGPRDSHYLFERFAEPDARAQAGVKMDLRL